MRRPSSTPSLVSLLSEASPSTPPLERLAHPPTGPSSVGPMERRPSIVSVRYRKSIASLRYLINNDTDLFESIAQEYSNDPSQAHRYSTASTASAGLDDSTEVEGATVVDAELRSFLRDSMIPSPDFPTALSSASSTFVPSPPVTPDLPPFSSGSNPLSRVGGDARHHRRSMSVGSHRRTIAKAAKLSNFFGTSRGVVWKVLLDDLSDVIREETDMEEEERAEVLEGVARLRMSAGNP